MRISIKLDSKALERQLSSAFLRNAAVTRKTITAIALDLSAKSARRAPVETGDLRSNCHADLSGVKGAKSIATVGYSLPYALKQHEDLSVSHSRTDGNPVTRTIRYNTSDGKVTEYRGLGSVNRVAGGEAKFLEKPFLENEGKYLEKILKIPKEVLR